jgi:hypothetical protein
MIESLDRRIGFCPFLVPPIWADYKYIPAVGNRKGYLKASKLLYQANIRSFWEDGILRLGINIL